MSVGRYCISRGSIPAAFRGLLLVATALFATSCSVAIQENHFFNPGPPQHAQPIAASGSTTEPHTITMGDGTKLAAAYVVTPGADVDILYFGGNASRIDDYGGELAELVAPLRANLFLSDYRGYGRSTGQPTLDSIEQDALAIFDYVRERSGGRPIVVHGLSLGSFLAANVAVNRPVAGLVLESTAPDVNEWAHANVPFYARPFVRLKIAPALLTRSNTEALRTYTGPLLLLTGSKDPVTPPRFAQKLAATSASSVKRAVIVPGASHGDAMMFPLAAKEYAAFLDTIRKCCS